MSPILKDGLEIPITMVLKKHKASPAVFNKTKELMLEHYTEHGMFWHWNCDLAQDSGFVISVPQITFTDLLKNARFTSPTLPCGSFKNPRCKIGAKSGAMIYCAWSTKESKMVSLK